MRFEFIYCLSYACPVGFPVLHRSAPADVLLLNKYRLYRQFWNDSRIGADNALNTLAQAALSKVTSRIRVIVRGDSSGGTLTLAVTFQ